MNKQGQYFNHDTTRYNNPKNETTIIGDMKSLQSIKVNDKFKKMGFPIPCLKMNCRFCVHSMLTSPMLYSICHTLYVS